MRDIKHIIPDDSGFKFLLIDQSRNAFLVKFDLRFNKI